MEVNGAGSEAIQAWDPDTSLVSAFRIIFSKQRLLFAIGAATALSACANWGACILCSSGCWTSTRLPISLARAARVFDWSSSPSKPWTRTENCHPPLVEGLTPWYYFPIGGYFCSQAIAKVILGYVGLHFWQVKSAHFSERFTMDKTLYFWPPV